MRGVSTISRKRLCSRSSVARSTRSRALETLPALSPIGSRYSVSARPSSSAATFIRDDEVRLGARDRKREGQGRVVSGRDHEPIERVACRHRVSRLEARERLARLRVIGGDDDLPPGPKLLGGDVVGHELRRARDRIGRLRGRAPQARRRSRRRQDPARRRERRGRLRSRAGCWLSEAPRRSQRPPCRGLWPASAKRQDLAGVEALCVDVGIEALDLGLGNAGLDRDGRKGVASGDRVARRSSPASVLRLL